MAGPGLPRHEYALRLHKSFLVALLTGILGLQRLDQPHLL